MSTEEVADGPPKVVDCPQLVRKIEQRQFQSGVDQISPEADDPPMKRGRSALGQIGGVGQT